MKKTLALSLLILSAVTFNACDRRVQNGTNTAQDQQPGIAASPAPLQNTQVEQPGDTQSAGTAVDNNSPNNSMKSPANNADTYPSNGSVPVERSGNASDNNTDNSASGMSR